MRQPGKVSALRKKTEPPQALLIPVDCSLGDKHDFSGGAGLQDLYVGAGGFR
jgi:hypothetical protein